MARFWHTKVIKKQSNWSVPKTIEKESWVKHFRRQIKLTCSDSWYVTNNRGRIRLKVEGVGSVALPYDWTEKGAAQAIDRIKVGFKRFVESKGKLTLAKSFQQVQAASSKNQIDWNELVTTFRKFVPNASDITWKKSYLPVLENAGL